MNAALLGTLREALFLAVLVAAPPVLAATTAGFVMALVQTATRIEERTLSTVPRLIAALLALAIAGPWIGAQFLRFTRAMLLAIPSVART